MSNKANKTSLKHLQIDKANSVIVAVTSLAAFILVFTLFAVSAMWDIRDYQSRVVDQKEETRDILIDNLDVANTLNQSYQAFIAPPENIIGGSREAQGSSDGDNARIILDALPSRYDFPALATSVEAILSEEGVRINDITGSDEELLRSDFDSDAPVDIFFGFNVAGEYDEIESLVDAIERSIRPFRFREISIRADSTQDIRLEGSMLTYFQPEKRFEVVRKNLQP